MADEPRGDAITFRQQNAGQGDGSARAGVRGKGPDFAEGFGRNQVDAADWPFAGDAKIGQEIEFQAIQFGAGDQTDIHFTTGESRRALGRQIKLQIEQAPLRTIQEAPNQGPGIQVTDG